jgi:thiamine biosynthesis protein ThiI
MQKHSAVVIHFGEIWLKGKNRSSFVNRLLGNVKRALDGESYSRLANERDRFMLYLNDESDVASITEKLRYVFGVEWFAPVVFAENDIGSILSTANKLVRKGAKVRIVAHRSYKGVDFNSIELVRAFIERSDTVPFLMDKEADDGLFINVTQGGTIMHTDRIRGPGGLPVGCSGKAVILFSGGIDSPVAAYYAMKRGLFPIYVHVHALQSNDAVDDTKIGKIMALLSRYCRDYVSYYVPAHVFQAKAMKTPSKYELVLFKRFLIRLSERIAKAEGASTIVTGEGLSQVASQTVKNLTASERGSKLFIMRPLIGFDKNEIVERAMHIGTFDLSKGKYRDVCSFNAVNPSTGADAKVIDELYSKAGIGKAVTESVKRSKRNISRL